MTREYVCPICGALLNIKLSIVHDHYVGELETMLNKKGYKTIREGKMPNGKWYAPDLFVLKKLYLERVIEVIVGDPYEDDERSVKAKAQKIKDYYNPPEIVIFEPIKYLDRFYLDERKNYYKNNIGFEPKSYIEVQNYFAKKWKNEGLKISFWNEEHLKTL